MTTVAISGNTYPVREQIKALGGRWNPLSKVWVVPADKADEAWKLVERAPKSTYATRYTQRRSSRCKGCGGALVDAPHHRVMGGYCGECAFDEYDC